MMPGLMPKIGVGIVGVNSGRGWASRAHIPALEALGDVFDIRAIASTDLERAREAAQAFGVPAFYDCNDALCRDPGVDLVVVTVKVPDHCDILVGALNAGKHVYCEWPLGRTLQEATELAALARRRGVHAVVGLQARTSPEITFLRDLVAQGFVGRVLSTSVIASGRSWGPTVEQPSLYLLDVRNGATMLSIPFGHTVDAICSVLGEFDRVTATLAVRRDRIVAVETGRRVAMTSHDQVAVSGLLEGGAVASVHFRGGMSAGENFLWEINGEDGDLSITAESGHIQMSELTIRGAKKDHVLAPIKIPAHYRRAARSFASGPSRNVGVLYARLAADISNNTQTAPSFETALARQTLLAMIERSASESRTVGRAEFPTTPAQAGGSSKG
jgi:predicted dehydrogenase